MNNKLIVFSYDFPPSNGGIARLCQEIAVGMQAFYNKVLVVTLAKKGINKPYNFDKVQVIYLPNKRIKAEISAYRFLSKIEDKDQYDVLCGLWHPEATISMLAGFKKVYILGHGTEFLSGNNKFIEKFWLPVYAKLILGKAALNIANSLYSKRLILEINKNSKAVALPLGVNEKFFKPAFVEKVGVLRISSLSRILQFKGYDFIAQTIAKLPLNFREKIQWNVGGTGPYLVELQKLVNELQINHLVTFYGFIPDENLPEFYASSDLFVLCTREEKKSRQVEGFGLVFLEAQACGVPVVGTRSGGIPDAISEGNGGWLIEQDNYTELSTIFINCILDKSIVMEQSVNARERIEKYCTWDQYNAKLYKLITS
jgi:phosphatidylinositol alpha-1,6-mannosyltransferase